MEEDPAITRAKELWQSQQPKAAMAVLIRRINELNARLDSQAAKGTQESNVMPIMSVAQPVTGVKDARAMPSTQSQPKPKLGLLHRLTRGCLILFFGSLVLVFLLEYGSGGTGQQGETEERGDAVGQASDQVRPLQDILRDSVKSSARVTFYEEKINSEGRLEADVELTLTSGHNRRTALEAIEASLVTFARNAERPGYIFVQVQWTHDGVDCADNAGMGYKVISTINWTNPSQSGIFRAIDRNIYGDEPGRDYSDMAWAPDASIIEACNR